MRSRRSAVIMTLCSAILFQLNAQIVAPATVCKNELFLINATTDGTSQLSWDFCQGDLLLTPTMRQGTVSDFNIPVGTSLIKANGQWYGFICSLSNNSLIRLDFGLSLSNSPTATNLGNVGGLLNAPQAIKVIEFDGKFFAFVYNRSVNKLIRINFENTITTITATAAPILSGNGFDNGGLDVVFDGTNWIAAISNSNSLTLVKLGNSPANSPQAGDILNTSVIPGVTSIGDMEFVNENDNWFAMVAGASSWTLHRLDFSTNLFSDPVPHTVRTFQNSPYGMAIEKDNGKWIMLVSTLEGNLLRLDFGSSIENSTPPLTNLGKLGGMNNLLKLDIAVSDSRWYALTANWNSKIYYIIEFPESSCPFGKSTSSAESEKLSTDRVGAVNITLYEKLTNGIVRKFFDAIDVTSAPAPELDFTTSSLCEQHSGIFSAQSNQTLTSVMWDFGTNGTSSSTNPSVTFSTPGTYPVRLEALSASGCRNLLFKDLKIYPLLANKTSFTLPSGIICTNNEITFPNTTTDNFDGNLSYEWFVDNALVNTARDLKYTFQTTGVKAIRLKTSIPGCSDELSQNTSSVGAGPIVDFSYSGKCEENEIQFNAQISESIVSQSWDFADGNNSTDANPKNTFADPGNYSVTLSALSPSGCNNSKTKTVDIFSKPAVYFSVAAPPSSCTGVATSFTDLTPAPNDSQLASWSWNFDDIIANSSTTANATHIYSTAGNYNVSLTITTDQGCTQSFAKPVVIYQSPSAFIGNSIACNTLPVNFTATGSGVQNYYWEIGASYYTEAAPTHTFNLPGTYNVKLAVKAGNNCEFQTSKAVVIPVPLIPDFSIVKNCVGVDAVLSDITTGIDAVASHQWQVTGQPAKNGSPVSYNFQTPGNKNVTLTVQGQSGCTYAKTKPVNVVPAPVANFTVDPPSGAVPLLSNFTNTSTGSTKALWSFGNGAISTLSSPSYTFQAVGDYTVELNASNEEGCESKISKVVSAQTPSPDVDLKLISYSQNPDGSLKVIITLQNNGNTIITGLPVDIDISGMTAIREVVQGPIKPLGLYNLVLAYTFTQPEKLNFFCVTTTLPQDVTPGNNRLCKDVGGRISMMDAFPNPANSRVNIQWIAQEEEVISITIADMFGKLVLNTRVSSRDGLNEYSFDASAVESGIYILLLKSRIESKTQRILIAR